MTDSNYQAILGLRSIRQTRSEALSPEDLDQILEAARWTGSSKNIQRWAFVVVTGDQKERLCTAGDFTTPLLNAPVGIALAMAPDGYEFDIGKAAQNIMLAAQAIGVASCPITLHRSGEAAETLGLAEGWQCRYAVSLGYPSGAAAAAKFGGRKARADVVFAEQFGQPF
jgi:nitroreductase